MYHLLCCQVDIIMADTQEGGDRVIAASRRPDGTLRKERKIRPGFVPQEEQQVYVSRGAAVSRSNTRDLHLLPGFILCHCCVIAHGRAHELS